IVVKATSDDKRDHRRVTCRHNWLHLETTWGRDAGLKQVYDTTGTDRRGRVPRLQEVKYGLLDSTTDYWKIKYGGTSCRKDPSSSRWRPDFFSVLPSRPPRLRQG